MPQVSVRECVRANLQPHYDGVDLADRANHRVVDVPVHSHRGYEQAKRCVDSVSPCNNMPDRSECLGSLSVGLVFLVSLHAADDALGLGSCSEFDAVR